MKPFRIGAGAGYCGDRIDPAQALAERGELDVLVFECLAERTIALAQLRKSRDPSLGYDPLLAPRMRGRHRRPPPARATTCSGVALVRGIRLCRAFSHRSAQ